MADIPAKTEPAKAAKAKTAKAKGSGSRPDLATVGGLAVALGGIVCGFMIEGGQVMQLMQVTAALIVFGGTLGAVMVTTPLDVLKRAVHALVSVFMEKQLSPRTIIEEVIGYATKARKNGIVSLEQEAEQVTDPFLRKALNLAVDGTDLQEIRKMMELEMGIEDQRAEAEARVFESAGGYAPTIGIIGAVLGLIQVMKNLQNIEKVGEGIAVAFVATVYGVASANIIFIPAGSKIRARTQAAMQMKELMLEGVAGIVEGLNPKLIRTKLEAYALSNLAAPGKEKKKPAKAAQPAAAAAPAKS